MTVIATAWSPEAIVALVVGLASAVGAVLTWWLNGVRAERTRLQKLYADAFAAVVSYQEFPYVIQRRCAPFPGHEEIGNDERLRISGALSEVQKSLNTYRAQIRTEASTVSERYEALVTATRKVAGGYMHDAWQAPPLDNDPGMNVAHVDYSTLEEPQQQYLDAVQADLRFFRVALPFVRHW